MRRAMRIVVIVASAMLVAGVALLGCSEPVAGGSGGTQSPEDCEEDEEFHPVAETCVSEDELNGDNDGTNDTSNSGSNSGTNQGTNNNSGTNSGANNTEECGPGMIKGQACRPDGSSLAGAQIELEGEDCDGNPYTDSVTADEQGMYELDGVPSGEHEMTISSGSFETSQPVYVNPGEVTDLEQEAAKICVGDSEVELALIEGGYDDIGAILNDLEIDFDVVGTDEGVGVDDAADFLSDPAEMQTYDILFIECGGLWTALNGNASVSIGEVMDNLSEFVEAGNSLYVSDQAHPFVQLALPDAIDFYNESDQSPENSWMGEDYGTGFGGSPLNADVVSSEMSGVLGMNTVDLVLTGGWAIPVSAGADSTIHFEGDANVMMSTEMVYDVPLMVTYDEPGSVEGRAIFTAFHNQEQADDVIQEIMEYMIFQL